jgi:hypothetical protein
VATTSKLHTVKVEISRNLINLDRSFVVKVDIVDFR